MDFSLTVEYTFTVMNAPIIDRIAAALAARSPQTLEAPGFKEAAVLVPIQQKDESAHLVLTQRTETLNSHRGQVAFPGGKIEPLDASAETAALRESHEEIGVAPEHVRVLGQLDQVTAASDYLVTPFVGVLPYPYEFRLNPHETAALFSVPLDALIAEGCFKAEPRRFPPERRDPIYHFYYEGWDIWGATARIILQLLELSYGYRIQK
ncbi:MAG TPA: CoA pyrophosphatase [Candidatus Binatia bacterium]|jgi:8-oxo-dGTP pyrophosphatase MutT (NUDIX family)